MTARPSLLVLSSDLMSSVRITDTAARAGYQAATVDAPGGLEGAVADVIVIDIASSPVEPAVTVGTLRAANPDARFIAVYRHTDPEQARAARAAGCDLVINRAQFFGDIAAALLPPKK